MEKEIKNNDISKLPLNSNHSSKALNRISWEICSYIFEISCWLTEKLTNQRKHDLLGQAIITAVHPRDNRVIKTMETIEHGEMRMNDL